MMGTPPAYTKDDVSNHVTEPEESRNETNRCGSSSIQSFDPDNDFLFARDELPKLPNEQLEVVLNVAVHSRMWITVREVLKRGVSDSLTRSAVIEACKYYKEKTSWPVSTCFAEVYFSQDHPNEGRCPVCDRIGDFKEERAKAEAGDPFSGLPSSHALFDYILSYCANDQMDTILKILIKRQMWAPVAVLLQYKGVSDSQKRWVVEEACRVCQLDARCDYHAVHVLCNIWHCGDDQVESVLNILVKKHAWESAMEMFKRNVSNSQKRWCILEACDHLSEQDIVQVVLPHYVHEDVMSVLKLLVLRGMWKAVLVLLNQFVIDALHAWAVNNDEQTRIDAVLADVVTDSVGGIKKLSCSVWKSFHEDDLPYTLRSRLNWSTPLCEVFCESLLEVVKEMWHTGRQSEMANHQDSEVTKAKLACAAILEELMPLVWRGDATTVSNVLPSVHKLTQKFVQNAPNNSNVFAFYLIKHLISECFKNRARSQLQNAVLIVLTTVPVAFAVQSVALRVMLRNERWDVISHACLTRVWEQDRRHLMQAAVKQRQWSAVKRWADHTLHDDQRAWALEEAFKAKQWEVCLLLADHGLTDVELMHLHHRLAKMANWEVVIQMFERGGYVTEVKEWLIEKAKPSHVRGGSVQTESQRMLSSLSRSEVLAKISRLTLLEKKILRQTTLKRKKYKSELKWCVRLFEIVHFPGTRELRQAVTQAMEDNAWHVVIQLVRLGMDAAQRDSLFPEMVRRQQWGVCRALLEKRVSLQLCLDALPELMARSQWTLVGRVMEYNVDDALRLQVMSRALECREGSVVWKCISTLGHCLSVTEREELFNQAILREIWQAVKPLIEEKDETGIRHRDTALLEAIEQHQWDVVDHCQRHHADINMKDDDGHTPIQRAAKNVNWSFKDISEMEIVSNNPSEAYHLVDWQKVSELVIRGGDPSQLDDEGYSVLHRSIRATKWDVTKLLIQFHGNIHRLAQCGTGMDTGNELHDGDTRTPLEMLIDERHGELIESTLMWCPDQWKGRGFRGTALHAVCASGRPDAVYYLIARKVDPLAVTWKGLTALCYAVLHKEEPQMMVAECIKRGFSTHQPHITDTAQARFENFGEKPSEKTKDFMKSPLVLAVMRGLPVVTQMLYESGACSNRQLFELDSHLDELTDHTTREGRYLLGKFKDVSRELPDRYRDYSCGQHLVEQSADYLRLVASTPRSLVSTCRLVISRCLTLSKMRQGDIMQLPLSPMMKKYLLFSDLTDPAYGKEMRFTTE